MIFLKAFSENNLKQLVFAVIFNSHSMHQWVYQVAGSVLENWLPVQKHTEDVDLIPGSGILPDHLGNGNPLQCSCLQNSIDKGAWQATVNGVMKSQMQWSTHTMYNKTTRIS